MAFRLFSKQIDENNLHVDLRGGKADAKNALEYLKAYASRMAENATRIASLMAFFDGRKTVTTDDIKRGFMLVEYSTTGGAIMLGVMG